MSDQVLIPLSSVRANIKLPAPIYDGDREGVLLLNLGQVLTSTQIDKMKERGVKHVGVDPRFSMQLINSGEDTTEQATAESKKKVNWSENRKSKDSLVNQIHREMDRGYTNADHEKFQEKTRSHSKTIEGCLANFTKNPAKNAKAVLQVTHESLDQLRQDIDLFVKCAIDSENCDDMHEHCLRVSQLAMSMATIKGHSQQDVHQLGIGCLVSRIGFLGKALELAQSGRVLSESELLEVRRFPILTYDMLEKNREIPPMSKQIAYQIQERWDGSGFPRGRSRFQIHPLARIASVADSFVALTSYRPYREPYHPYDAVKKLLEDTQNGKYDPATVRLLFQTVCLFPIGSYVQLSDDQLACVVRNNPDVYDRPIVRMVSEDQTETEDGVVDLNQRGDVQIIRALSAYEAQLLLSGQPLPENSGEPTHMHENIQPELLTL